MPAVHIIGEIEGASGFPSSNLFCKWKVIADKKHWDKIEGSTEGQTQVDFPVDGEYAVFAHPIDLHYSTTSFAGWPKLSFQIWHQDFFGRNELYGYGFCHVPMTPGHFDLEVVTWRPVGTFFEEVTAYFLGGAPQLRNDELIASGEDRYRLRTKTMGTIHLSLAIILKDFAKQGVHW